MINILSYVGMSLQSEVCLWTLLGLIRTIFDATLFKVNANLKQVWQMSMPIELSVPVQRGLRTMISGIMLVQCFTVYIYLASYIVLLYPVFLVLQPFLEERPALVLPWLLLAAVRKLLCELTSLALGLGTCVLLGPAKPPCVKFVVIKVISIMPSFYMWMLLYSYYHTLKVASVFKTFSTRLPASEIDYGLELAVRRRRAKSLLGEEQLRRRLISNCFNNHDIVTSSIVRPTTECATRITHGTDTSTEDATEDPSTLQSISNHSHRILSCTPFYFEDWLCHEVIIPRDTDRILEQFSTMMLQIGAYISKEGINSTDPPILSPSEFSEIRQNALNCTTMPPDSTDTPPLVGSSNARTPSYLRDYPQIFMKKPENSLSFGRDSSIGRQPQLNTAIKEENDLKLYHRGSHSLTSNVSVIIDADIPACSKKINDEVEKAKVQKKSSEKVVKFTQNNRNHSAESANDQNGSYNTKTKFNTKDVSNSTESLFSLTDKTNSTHSLYVTSLKKDESKYGTGEDINLYENILLMNIASSTSLEDSTVSFNTDKATTTYHAKKTTN